MHKKDRGRLHRNPNVGREDTFVYLHARGMLFDQIARIDRDREVRPATYLVDLVDRLVGALVEVGRRRHGQVAARREAEDADSVRVDPPLRRPAPHQTDRPLRVQQWTRSGQRLGLTWTTRHAILEHEARHTERVEPSRNLFAFQVPGQIPVTSARTDEDRRPGVLVLGRPEDGDCRPLNAGYPLRIFRWSFGRRTHALWAVRAEISRNRSRPDRQHRRLCCPLDRADQEEPDEQTKPAGGPNLGEQLFAIDTLAHY